MEYVISQADKAILREVARKQLELANQEKISSGFSSGINTTPFRESAPWRTWKCGPSLRKFFPSG